ncbi:MAG: hypothetical protein ACLQVK_10640 [Acidimicrobiales bacterium]
MELSVSTFQLPGSVTETTTLDTVWPVPPELREIAVTVVVELGTVVEGADVVGGVEVVGGVDVAGGAAVAGAKPAVAEGVVAEPFGDGFLWRKTRGTAIPATTTTSTAATTTATTPVVPGRRGGGGGGGAWAQVGG